MLATASDPDLLDPPADSLCGGDEPPEEFDSDGDDDGDPVRWATVATFWEATEAHLARIKLEAEDIDCVIVDENVVAVQWLWANALGGIKLKVPEEDLQRAGELLKSSSPQPRREISDEPLFDGLARCPRCGSDDIQDRRFSRMSVFVSILLLGVPLAWPRRRKHCGDCGFEWPPPEPPNQR